MWNPRGLTTEAPVFSRQPQLPTLLGQFVHTLPLFRDLSLADRATMLPLVLALFDYKSSEAQYRRYDQAGAAQLSCLPAQSHSPLVKCPPRCR